MHCPRAIPCPEPQREPHPAQLWLTMCAALALYYALLAWVGVMMYVVCSSTPNSLRSACGCAHAWGALFSSLVIGAVTLILGLCRLLEVQSGYPSDPGVRMATRRLCSPPLRDVVAVCSAVWVAAAIHCLRGCSGKAPNGAIWCMTIYGLLAVGLPAALATRTARFRFWVAQPPTPAHLAEHAERVLL